MKTNSDRPAFAWGYNNQGGLGAAGTARALEPISVQLPTGTIDVKGGSDFTVALTDAGRVYTWGGNQWGQLGDGSTKTRLRPHPVSLPGGPKILSIAAGQDHVIALASNGRVFGWGRNHHGQVGAGGRSDRSAPAVVGVPDSHTIVGVAAGNASSYAISNRGLVHGWGSATPLGEAAPVSGLLDSAIGVTNVVAAQPLTLPRGAKAAAVDAGQRHLVILTTDGRLLTYGLDTLSRPITSADLRIDESEGPVAAISVGDNHTVALTSSGNVFAWGANTSGQLATRDTVRRDAPVKVRIPKQDGRVVQVVAAGDSSLARTDTGAVYSWGRGDVGQHGSGNTENRTRPERIVFPRHKTAAHLFAGRYHHFATTS